MPRTSPVHYINPSAISLTANANGSTNDIAVYIDRNAKIKVYSPKVGLNLSSGDYQEWSLRGRNRRLANSAKKYAIYARLRHNDHEDGYLVFAAMEQYTEGPRAGQWYEKYWHVGPEGWEGGYEEEDGWAVIEPDPTYWYIKLGEVSLPENHQRTIDLDTGILGTEQFNTEWALNPDSLPLRIEFSCTINDDDAGPTPYVYWGRTLLLVAMLTEGWNGTDIERFDHWEIARDTGNVQADAWWADAVNLTDFRTTGSINLMHGRGAGQGVRDDFNSAVNTTFIINAMERTDDPEQGGTPTYAVLKSASICIMAETWEKYELSLAAQMVTYNPISQSYTPSDGVTFNVRATDQKSEVFLMTRQQVTDAGLVVEYAAIDSSSWTAVAISGQSGAVAIGKIAKEVFYQQKSINIRLRNSDDTEHNTGTELFRTTVAFLRDGEDSKEREWIFLRSATEITFGTQEHPYPASISGGQVNPTGAATGSDTNKNQDGWVPEGWWDEQQGVDATNRFEYGAYRDYDCTNNQWGAFTMPKIWHHYGTDGDDGLYYVDDYGRASSRSLVSGFPGGFDSQTGWQDTAPATSDTYKYIWKRSRQYNPNTRQYGTASYTCLTGAEGNNGVDAKDVEWVYIRTKTNIPPVIDGDDTYTDSNGHAYTADDHLPKVVPGTGGSASDIESDNSGSGSKPYECTDDPKGVDDTWKYEWEIKRTKGAAVDGHRTWNCYSGAMTLHNNLAESAFIIDTDNDNDQFGTDSDGKVLVSQTRSTTVKVYDGSTPQALTSLSVELKYDDGTAVPATVATYTATPSTGVVAVTILQNTTTAFPHEAIQTMITASVTGKGSKSTVFTIRKVMSGQPGLSPTIYQLNPTNKTFTFGRDASNNLTPSSRSTVVNALKTVGNTTTPASSSDGLTFSWGFDEEAATAGHTGLALDSTITVSNSEANAHYQVWVQLSTGDRETLPIIKEGASGAKGQDSQYVYLKGTARDNNSSVTTAVDCVVNINGGANLVTTEARGLNLVTINRQTLAVVESINYDTYGEAAETGTGITNLIAKLNALDNSVFVCLVSYDAVGWSAGLIAKLQEYGMGDLPYTDTGRHPFLFIGYKDLGKGNGLMRMRDVGAYTDVVELSVYVANGALSSHDGQNGAGGAKGEDAVNVVVSPASMIIEQDINNKNNIEYAANKNLGMFSIQVLKGIATACTITRIVATASNVYVYNSASTGPQQAPSSCDWQPNSQIANLYLKGIAKDNQNNYYTTGQIVLAITYTDPDTGDSKTITSIIARVYVNLIGTWSEEVVGDAKTEVAKSLSYAYDPSGRNVISLENMGKFIKSSTQDTSELRQKVYVDILNLTYPATSSSIDGMTVNVLAGTYKVAGEFNLANLPTGNGYLTFVGPGVNKTWDLTGGLVDSIDDEVTFTSAGVLTISAGDDISSGSDYDILNLAIYQSQDKIAKLELTADGLTSDVNAIKAGKNLLSGTLTGSGWYKGTAGSRGIVVEAITDNDVDNGRISVGNKQYLLSTDCNFVAGKSYTLSFQNDDVTTLYVGIAYGPLSASPFEYFAITKNSDGRFVHTFAITQSNSYRLCIDFDENSIASANRYIYHPMFEEGTEATAFDAGDTEVSSQIKQEADNIEMKVKNGLSDVGISILGTENKIVLNADTTEIKNGSQTTAMFRNGKIMAAYIDAVTVLANALVSSTINADNATINNLKLVNAEVSGKIVANLMYSPTNIISQTGNIERKYTIDLVSNPCSAFLCHTENAGLKIMLPKAADYDGIELSFYYDRNYPSSYGGVYVFQNSNETSGVKKIRSRKWNVLTSQEGVQFEAPNPEYYIDPSFPSSNNPFYANAVLLGFNQSITFKSMGSTWYVINGRVADASGTSW